MPIIEITRTDDPAVIPYTLLTEHQLRQRTDDPQGLFIAESPKVIRTALQAGYLPVSLLCERKHLQGDASFFVEEWGHRIPIYTGERSLLSGITGYTLTRGVLCAMQRQPEPLLRDICQHAKRIVVIDHVVDTTNIGAIFRSATALGMDAVLLTRTSCDPLNRRSIRVSMGTVFQIPWTWIEDAVDDVKEEGFTTVAMALSPQALPLDAPQLQCIDRMAILMGNEGDGLPPQTVNKADHVAMIPMFHQVDSLNVAAATAVACWQFRRPSHL